MPAVEHIYVSPLIRCRQTAMLLWPKQEQTIIPQLRETDFGPFEGKNHEELKDDPLYNRWMSEPDDPTIVPQVEDPVSCAMRATEGLKLVAAQAKERGFETVGVVSHGGTLMSILLTAPEMIPPTSGPKMWSFTSRKLRSRISRNKIENSEKQTV